jgi:hypothetical protein
LPKLKESLVKDLARLSIDPKVAEQIEFYFGFDEIREKRNFVLATRDEVLTLPLELAMSQEWVETMCAVCKIAEADLKALPNFDNRRYAVIFDGANIEKDFAETSYRKVNSREAVVERGQFYIDEERRELSVRLLPAIYPHHIVGLTPEGLAVNISICGQSGRSGITIESAKQLCRQIGLTDALIFDNGNDVFARYESRHTIAHHKNNRHTRLTAALHFADLVTPGPDGLCDVQSSEVEVRSVGISPS